MQKLAEGTVDKSIVRNIFLQRISAQYKIAISSLDTTIPVENLVSVADHIADLLSTQQSAVTSIQVPECNVFTELKEGK